MCWRIVLTGAYSDRLAACANALGRDTGGADLDRPYYKRHDLGGSDSLVRGGDRAIVRGPAYSALVPSLVEREDAPNAIALNSIQFNLARVIGPVIGGLAMKYAGAGWCFGLNALSFLAVIISLSRLHINFSPPRTGASVMTSMKEGFTFVRAQGAMTTLILIAFLMTFLAIPTIASLPVFAKMVFGRGEMTYTGSW